MVGVLTPYPSGNIGTGIIGIAENGVFPIINVGTATGAVFVGVIGIRRCCTPAGTKVFFEVGD